jgi:hypothetical protein
MSASELCKFNVGGVQFVTTMTTLQALNQTNFLTTLVENDRDGSVGCIKDDQGFLFIDHSARLFEVVLDYLRTGQLTLPVYATRRQIMGALDFYGIPAPQRQFCHVKDQMSNSNGNKSSGSNNDGSGAAGQTNTSSSSASSASSSASASSTAASSSCTSPNYSSLNLSSIELTESDSRDATQLLQEWQRRASVFFDEHLDSLSNHVRRSIAEGRDPISVVSFHTAGHQVQGIPLHELKMSDTGSIGPLLWSKRPTMVFLRYLRMLIEEQWGLPAHIKVVNPGQLGEWSEIRMHCTRDRSGDDIQVVRDILEVCFDEHRSTLRVTQNLH